MIRLPLLLCLFVSSCFFTDHSVRGNGNLATENRDLQGFSAIYLSGNIDVYVRQGAYKVSVEADDNLLPLIVTRVEDGKLQVRNKENSSLKSDNDIKVYVTSPKLEEVKVTGSGNVQFEEKLAVENPLVFGISGSGNIKANLNAPQVEGKITGSGNMTLSGETRDEKVSITGSGNYNGYELKSENVTVQITGSGDAKVYAAQTLKANIAGSGSVKYMGNAHVETKIAGSGSVNKAQ